MNLKPFDQFDKGIKKVMDWCWKKIMLGHNWSPKSIRIFFVHFSDLGGCDRLDWLLLEKLDSIITIFLFFFTNLKAKKANYHWASCCGMHKVEIIDIFMLTLLQTFVLIFFMSNFLVIQVQRSVWCKQAGARLLLSYITQSV